jgi:glucose-6-phosphate isomerase
MNIDLQVLNMKVEFDSETLVYGSRRMEPDIRTFAQMQSVLAFPNAECRLTPESKTYFMYRGAEGFASVRYDITRIPQLDLCGERNKTMGHVHPKTLQGASWCEIYEVLSGEAHFMLQKVDGMGVRDAAVLSAKKGEKLIIPPNYGHVTVNAGKTDLVLANLVSGTFSSDYAPYVRMRGACVYETIEGKLVPNKNYGAAFEIRELGASEFSETFGCFEPFRKADLLTAAKKMENLGFLAKPETFY